MDNEQLKAKLCKLKAKLDYRKSNRSFVTYGDLNIERKIQSIENQLRANARNC